MADETFDRPGAEAIVSAGSNATLRRRIEAIVSLHVDLLPALEEKCRVYARHLISRTETRNYVGQFSVHILEADKTLVYWLSFCVKK